MRKFALGTVAAAAGVALALPATADEMMSGVSISGYMNHDFGFGSYDGGVDNPTVDEFHQEIDAELTFSASGTTDGGLMLTASMQVDADNAGVDESALTIAGGFGKIIIGSEDNAANRHGNKGIGGGYGGGGYYDCGETWQPAKCGTPVGSDDDLGIQFDTPNIGGFQAGVSFQPESGSEANSSTGVDNDSNVIAVGANFSGEFAGTALTIGAGLKSSDSGGADATTTEDWGIGAAFGVGATSLSLRYDVKGAAEGDDTTSYGVGVNHGIGALSFGVGYSMRQEPTADHSLMTAGASYDLGGGASVSGAINSGEIDNDATADVDDVGIGMRIAFSF